MPADFRGASWYSTTVEHAPGAPGSLDTMIFTVDNKTDTAMPTGNALVEGPVEHIRNALQIANGMAYMLEACQTPSAAASNIDATQLIQESLQSLEVRLAAALVQLTQSSPVARRHQRRGRIG